MNYSTVQITHLNQRICNVTGKYYKKRGQWSGCQSRASPYPWNRILQLSRTSIKGIKKKIKI